MVIGGINMVNKLVVKSNKLIEARYALSLNEQKIVLYAVSKLDTTKDKFNILELETREFMQLLNTSQFKYTEIRELVSNLMSKQVRIETDKRDLVANWVSSIDYIKDTGLIELEFSEKLIPYLLQLKEQFTRYELKNILYLKNKHSIRIYELLKQYQVIGHRTFTIDELKKILMLEGKYEQFRDFNKSVLKLTTEEINEFTDLNIDIELIRQGRKVVSVKYIIQTKDQQDKKYIEYLNESYDIKDLKLRMGLSSENFSSKQIMSIYEKAIQKTQDDLDLFEYVRLNYIYMIEKGAARNKYSYLLSALENDYAAAQGQLSLLNMI